MIEYVLNAKSGAEWELDHADAVESVKRLPKNKSWLIKITAYREDRSGNQLRALYGLAYKILSAETGYTADELHEAFCSKFFGSERKNVMGNWITKPTRTTTTDYEGKRDVIDKAQFAEFFSMVQQIAAESNVFIPDPDKARAR